MQTAFWPRHVWSAPPGAPSAARQSRQSAPQHGGTRHRGWTCRTGEERAAGAPWGAGAGRAVVEGWGFRSLCASTGSTLIIAGMRESSGLDGLQPVLDHSACAVRLQNACEMPYAFYHEYDHILSDHTAV